MILFVKLILAYLLSDFLLQPASWVRDKESKKYKSIYFYSNAIVYFALILILIGDINFIRMAALLMLSHGIIDLLQLNFQTTRTKRNWFSVKHIFNLLVIIATTISYNNTTLDLSAIGNQFWIVVTAFIFLTKPSSIIIKNIISIWTPEKNKTKSLQNAGNYIGILERLFVFCFIVTGHFEAIGFLLAAKSIFRFGDLKEAKDRMLTEYVLIGTLISFGIAMVIGFLVQISLGFSF
ncbi:DUF3307 domain-containing protein [Flavobacterium weaverense]|uniref:Uncharacterized protein DUF3307 n=1 Tax=Flavobacterium weaverense TaxID=271156 RepID=A0A3M0A0Y1_9FLAO|nr:DUF3307 domain-containing protein [Flavobacterium weaverense]RMA76285.1 uncharacterized protein DUF3307 [Flavobacterium weaverense]